jgi:hypothetical protein
MLAKEIADCRKTIASGQNFLDSLVAYRYQNISRN